MARKIIQLKNKNNDELFLLFFPIGSIYMSVNPTNPKEFFGGRWELWGKGRTPVCVDSEQEEFKNVEQIGGEKEHTLTINEMPKHNHTFNKRQGTASTGPYEPIGQSGGGIIEKYSTDNKGNDQPHNNMQPYITCYMWKRIA